MVILTENEMINIIKNKQINLCNEDQRKQIMSFAFGEEYISSNDKGTLKEYEEVKHD